MFNHKEKLLSHATNQITDSTPKIVQISEIPSAIDVFSQSSSACWSDLGHSSVSKQVGLLAIYHYGLVSKSSMPLKVGNEDTPLT